MVNPEKWSILAFWGGGGQIDSVNLSQEISLLKLNPIIVSNSPPPTVGLVTVEHLQIGLLVIRTKSIKNIIKRINHNNL